MLYRFSFFLLAGLIRSPYSSPMSHCHCEIAGILGYFWIITSSFSPFFPCLISVFGTKKVTFPQSSWSEVAKSRSGRLGFDFPSSLRLHLCDVGHESGLCSGGSCPGSPVEGLDWMFWSLEVWLQRHRSVDR